MRKKIIALLYQYAGTYVSGQEMSEQLGISRTAVWKHIRSLQQEGYAIETGHRKGYRLTRQQDELLPPEIQEHLVTKWLGNEIVYHETVASTNLWAKDHMAELGHGSIVVANEQTQGRGRMGRRWDSSKGEGIWMTMVLRPELPMSEGGKITQMAAVAMFQAILQETGLVANIKWPNDLLIEEKKICGILTEMTGELNRIEHLFVGIGVNVNQKNFPADIQETAASLYSKTHRQTSRSRLVAAFLKHFEGYYDAYVTQHVYDVVLEVARAQSSLLGKPVNVFRGEKKQPATAVQLHEDGRLEVVYSSGERELLSGGEVSIRAQNE